MSHPAPRSRKAAAHHYEQLTLFRLPDAPDGPSPSDTTDAVRGSRANGPAPMRRSKGDRA